jgi:DNA-binding transcriptional LysR family regulator
MIKPDFTLRQLEVFASVARQRSVTRAAAELHLSQPAVSLALNELEKQFEQPLFERARNRLRLNDAGRRLYPLALNMLAQYGNISSAFGGRKGFDGQLKLGASSTIGNYVMPEIIGRFMRQYPDAQLTMTVDNTEKIAELLADYQLDAAFVEGPCFRPELETAPWRQDRLRIFCGNDFFKETDVPPSWRQIRAKKWILREKGSGTRTVFENALSKAGKSIKVFLELGHTEAIKKAVECGLGISCLSEKTITREVETGQLRIIDIPGLELDREFYMLLNNKREPSLLANEFIALCV